MFTNIVNYNNVDINIRKVISNIYCNVTTNFSNVVYPQFFHDRENIKQYYYTILSLVLFYFTDELIK